MYTNTQYHAQRVAARDRSRLLPFRYVFVLTNLCNLKCSFCFQEKRYSKNSLTPEDWISVISALPSSSHITLTGGEPLLFNGLADVVSSIRNDQTFNVITNGLLLTEEKIRMLLSSSSLRVLSISIDDVGNKSRDFTSDQWETLLNNIELFKSVRNKLGRDKEVTLDVKSVVHSGNFSSIEHIAELCSSLRVDTHMLMFVKGSPMQHSDVMHEYESIYNHPVHNKEYFMPKLLDQLYLIRDLSKRNTNSTKFYLHPSLVSIEGDEDLSVLAELLDQEYHDASRFEPCNAPWESVHINHDGTLFPCLAFNAGNVRSEDISEIVNGVKMTRFKSILKECGTLPACKQCGYLLRRKS